MNNKKMIVGVVVGIIISAFMENIRKKRNIGPCSPELEMMFDKASIDESVFSKEKVE